MSTELVQAAHQDAADNLCAICHEDLASVPKVARPTVCRHQFCLPCLQLLCQRSADSAGGESRCPLDRKPFSQFLVTQRDSPESGEEAFCAKSLQPVRQILNTPLAASALACCLLAVLWANPSWLLGLHLASLAVIYVRTNGVADWRMYGLYTVIFYGLLVPAALISLAATIYGIAFCSLVLHFYKKLTQSRGATGAATESMLAIVTAVLAGLVYPAALFSLYTLAQAYCYSLCLALGLVLQGELHESHSHTYAIGSLLVFSLLHAPYLCCLTELSLAHLIYTCLWLGYLVVFLHQEEGTRLPEPRLFIRPACCTIPVLLLGYSPWSAAYAIAAQAYATLLLQQLDTEQGRMAVKRSPMILGVNVAIVGLLLPYQLFGLRVFVGCTQALLASYWAVGHLMRWIESSSFRLAIEAVLQLVVLAVMLPAVLF